jgi:hypothetical protein
MAPIRLQGLGDKGNYTLCLDYINHCKNSLYQYRPLQYIVHFESFLPLLMNRTTFLVGILSPSLTFILLFASLDKTFWFKPWPSVFPFLKYAVRLPRWSTIRSQVPLHHRTQENMNKHLLSERVSNPRYYCKSDPSLTLRSELIRTTVLHLAPLWTLCTDQV